MCLASKEAQLPSRHLERLRPYSEKELETLAEQILTAQQLEDLFEKE